VDLSAYTHVHLAFATITTDFALDVSSIQDQFDSFVSMTGFKRILSVGGWAFCTDPSTYAIFREAVTQANMDAFVANIVSFIEEYQLDGIDIDWECEEALTLQFEDPVNLWGRSRRTRYPRNSCRYVKFSSHLLPKTIQPLSFCIPTFDKICVRVPLNSSNRILTSSLCRNS
jgi:hypothetical protein